MNKIEYIPLTKVLEKIVDNRGKSVPTVEQGFPLIATNCIKESSIYPTFENIRFVDDFTLNNWFRAHLAPNDILFVNKGTPGRVCLVPNPVTFCAAQDMIGFIADKTKINYKYLFAVLRSNWVKQKIQNYHVGLVIPHFKKQDLDSILIPKKTPKEQEFIGNLYISISEKIELNNRINRELEAMAKTLYDYWFVQFDFPNEQGKPYKSSGGNMVYNAELKREIPEGWEAKNIFKCCNVQYGFPFSTDYFNTDGKGVPVIRIRDILENSISNYSFEQNIDAKYLIKKGDILVGMDGNFHINYWAKDGCYLNQRAVKLSETILPNIYLKYQIEPFIKLREKSVSRTTVGHLSDKDLKALSIIIPSKEVLSSISSIYNGLLKRMIQTQNENQQLSELRDWLLPMLMNGQVTVKEAEEKLSMAAEPSVEYKKG